MPSSSARTMAVTETSPRVAGSAASFAATLVSFACSSTLAAIVWISFSVYRYAQLFPRLLSACADGRDLPSAGVVSWLADARRVGLGDLLAGIDEGHRHDRRVAFTIRGR